MEERTTRRKGLEIAHLVVYLMRLEAGGDGLA